MIPALRGRRLHGRPPTALARSVRSTGALPRSRWPRSIEAIMRRSAKAAAVAVVLLVGCGAGTVDATEGPLGPDGPTGPEAPAKPGDPTEPAPDWAPLWGRSFADPAFENGYGAAGAKIVAGPDSSAIVAGDFRGALRMDGDGAPVPSTGESDVFVAQFDAEGQPLWSLQLGGTEDQIFSGLAVDPAGNVLVTGVFAGTMTVGGETLTALGLDVFLVKIDPDGGVLWTRRYGSDPVESIQWAHAVAADGDGNVLLAGNLEGTLDLGGTALTHGALFPFVVKLDPEGEPLWSATFKGSVDQEIVDIGADAAGNVLVAGHAERTDIQGVKLDGAGQMDLLAVSLTPAGALRWARLLGSEEDELLTGMAVDPAGDLVVSGTFRGELDIDDVHLTSPAGKYTGMVARLSGADGEAAWARALPSGIALEDIALDSAGDLVAAGTLTLTATAAGPLGCDAQVMRLDGSDGATLWTGRFGDAAEQRVTSIATDALGRALVAGVFGGAVEVGGAELSSESGHDLFAAALTPGN